MLVVHVVEFMLMMPLGPELIRQFKISPAVFSSIIASYAIAAGISSLAMATFADRFDRKRLLLAAHAGITLATFACALANSFESLFAARVLAGAFGGVITSICYAILGDLFPPHMRGRATGALSIAFPLSATLGVPFSIVLAQNFHWQTPFWVLGGLSLILFFLAAKLLPPVRAHLSVQQSATPARLFATLADALTHPNHTAAFALTIIVTFSAFLVIPLLAPVLTKNGLVPESMLSLAYGIGGACTIITVQLIGRWSDVVGKRTAFVWLTLGSAVPVLLITHLQRSEIVTLPVMLFVWALFMVLVSGRWTPALALITGASTMQQRGSFLAVNSAMMQFASGASTVVGGLILAERADGSIAHFERVGALSVATAMLGLWIVRRVRAVS